MLPQSPTLSHAAPCPCCGRRTALLRLLGGTAGMCLAASNAQGAQAAHAVAVVYPDVVGPFRSVFTKIVEGIEARLGGQVASFAVGEKMGGAELSEELRRRDVKVVVALGRQGWSLVSSHLPGMSLVVGCVVSVPEAQARSAVVHTLAPDPALLFRRLHELAPGVRRVLVVYDPRQNDWLVRSARESAKAASLEVMASEAADLREALRAYQVLLSSADPRRDALWLPQDSTTVEDGAVLPLVLKEAWDRNLPMFSSNMAHVRRGALFSLYPDNLELGRALAESALRSLASGRAQGGALALREVRMAVNTRTAAHLGVQLAPDLARYDLVFPER